MQTIARYFNMRKEMIDASTGKMPFYIDDITWNDLDMDRFYALINNCKSSAGQEYLYKRLRMPENDLGKALYFDKLAKFFDQNEDCRIKVQKIFVKLGITKKISVSDYISSLMQLEAEKKHNSCNCPAGHVAIFCRSICRESCYWNLDDYCVSQFFNNQLLQI